MGTIKNNDQVLITRRLEPTQPGSRIYIATDKETHVFDEDVRLKVNLEHLETRASTRSGVVATKRYTLKETGQLIIDERCCTLIMD